MDPNKCSENLGTDGFRRIPPIICVEGDTDMCYSADQGGKPSIQCKMTFNLSTSTGDIDGLSLHWL